jgi:hypothetical protein
MISFRNGYAEELGMVMVVRRGEGTTTPVAAAADQFRVRIRP